MINQNLLSKINKINLFDADFLKQNSIQKHSKAHKELLIQQRIRLLTKNEKIIQHLISQGIESANHIASMTQSVFLEQYCKKFSKNDNKTAIQIYKKAHPVRNQTFHAFANARNLAASTTFKKTYAYTASNTLSKHFEQLPSYQELFGNLDYVDCSEFKSIFSPAAYLVDLLRIIQTYITDPYQANIPKGLSFKERRPDIANIVLNIQETTTLIPKLQIANERLTNFIGNLIPTLKNGVPEYLNQSVYPFKLPVNLPLEQIRTILSTASLSLEDIYALLKVSPQALSLEALKLSPTAASLISTSQINSAILAKMYGVSNAISNLIGLSLATTFSKQTGVVSSDLPLLFNQNLSATEQQANLQTKFYINHNAAQFKHDDKPYLYLGNSGKPPALCIINLNTDSAKSSSHDYAGLYNYLDRLNRFIRLSQKLNLSFVETDWLLNITANLRNIGPNKQDILNAEALTLIGKIFKLAKLFKCPIAETVNVCADLKTYGCGTDNVSTAIFDIIFNNGREGEAYHPIFAGNTTYKTKPVLWAKVSTQQIPPAVKNILSGLEVNEQDLVILASRITSKTDILTLDVPTLSQLYRDTKLMKWLKLTAKELVLLYTLIGPTKKEQTLVDYLEYIGQTANWIAQAKTNTYVLNYIINGNTSRYINTLYELSALTGWLKALRVRIKLPQSKKVSSLLISQVVSQVAIFFNTPKTLINVLFLDPKQANSFVLKLLDPTVKIDVIQTMIERFSRILVMTKVFKFNAQVLTSIYKFPTSYGLNQFPATDNSIISLDQLKNLASFSMLSNLYSDTNNELVAFISATNNSNLDKAKQCLIKLTNWDWAQVTRINERYFKQTTDKNLVTRLALTQQILSLSASFGQSVASLFALADLTISSKKPDFQTYQTTAVNTLGQLRSLYKASDWTNINKKVKGELDQSLRESLESTALFLAQQQYTDIQSMRNLYEFLLIDVEVSGKIQTSYIKEAISAAQLYLQRVRLNIEQSVSAKDISDIWWEWISNYRIWEANREIYLYPENYLEPTLRRNQTNLFKDFSNTLIQGSLDKITITKAFEKYWSGFEDITDLIYVNSWFDDSSTGNTGDIVIYFFARTKKDPVKYYYCTYTFPKNIQNQPNFNNFGTWSSWKNLTFNINANNITPIFAFGKLFIFWVEMTQNRTADIQSKGTLKSTHHNVYKATIKYSFVSADGTWTHPQDLMQNNIIYYKSELGSANKLEDDASFSGLFDMNNPVWKDVFVTTIGGDKELQPITTRMLNVVEFPGYPKNAIGKQVFTALVSSALMNKAGIVLDAYNNEVNLLKKLGAKVFNVGTKTANPKNIPAYIKHIKQLLLTQRIILEGLASKNDPEKIVVLYGPFLNNNPNKTTPPQLLPEINAELEIFERNLLERKCFQASYPNTLVPLYPAFVLDESLNPSIFNKPSELLDFSELHSFVNAIDVVPYIDNIHNAIYAREIDLSIYRGQFGRYPVNYQSIALTIGDMESDQALAAALTKAGVAINPTIELIYNALVKEKLLSQEGFLSITDTTNLSNVLKDAGITKNVSAINQLLLQLLLIFKQKQKLTFFKNVDSQNIKTISVKNRNGQFLLNCGGETFLTTFTGEGFSGISQYYKSFSAHVAIIDFQTIPKINNTLANTIYTTLTSEFVIDNFGFVDPAILSSIWKEGEQQIKTWLSNVLPKTGRDLLVTAIHNILISSPQVTPAFFNSIAGFTTGITKKVLPALVSANLIDSAHRVPLAIWQEKGIKVIEKTLISTGITSIQNEALYTAVFTASTQTTITWWNHETMLHDVSQFSLQRMTTGAAKRLHHIFSTQGLEKLLSLSTQQIPIIPKLPFKRLEPGDLMPTPLASDGSQVDFTGPYGQYYWELFFHAPLLIAETLSNQQQHKEALYWLQFIFNPTRSEHYLVVDSFSTEVVGEFSIETSGEILKALQQHTLDNTPKTQPFVDKQGMVNVHYTGKESLSFLQTTLGITVAQTAMVHNILKRFHIISANNHYWQFDPFRNHSLASLTSILTGTSDNNTNIATYENDPFDPFALASLRIGAFEKYVLMTYVNTLISWGDALFTQNTRESITEAMLRYVYAYDLLGTKPQSENIAKTKQSGTFNDILVKYKNAKAIPDFLIELENTLSAVVMTNTNTETLPFNDLPDYFCVPENKQLLGYWDKLDDRLYKIRNSLTIDGKTDDLSLFAPPINPLELVRAAASGGQHSKY